VLGSSKYHNHYERIFFVILVISLVNAQGFTQIYELNTVFIKPGFDIINYVNNPSFEQYTACPNSVDELDKCKYWQRVPSLYDSPDYFHRCADIYKTFHAVIVGVDENVFGYQEPRTGDAYVGISTFERSHYQEYIQTQLLQPLMKGKTYIVGMHVSLAKKSKYANDRFKFCFTDAARLEQRSKIYQGAIESYLICPNGALYISDTLITDTINWVNIEVEYTAKGDEEFLTIGVFGGNISWWQRLKKRRNIFNKAYDECQYKVRGAYYYIDDVYVIRLEDYLNLANEERE
jgi:hypothetical protein